MEPVWTLLHGAAARRAFLGRSMDRRRRLGDVRSLAPCGRRGGGRAGTGEPVLRRVAAALVPVRRELEPDRSGAGGERRPARGAYVVARLRVDLPPARSPHVGDRRRRRAAGGGGR